jgi:D-alanine transaminase
MMKTLGYYNGEIGEIDDMKIPMNDRACWFGDAVYEVTVAIDHKLLFLEEHIDRLFSSTAALEMKPPLSKEELSALLSSLVRKVESPRQFVYWQISRGTGKREHVFPDCKANLWVFIRQNEERDFAKKIGLVSVPDTRFYHCNVKTINLIPNVLASQRAKEAGADEAVFYRYGGKAGDESETRVTECSHSNISILSGGEFRTAPLDNLILPGVARRHLIKQCGKLGIPVREEAFGLKELFAADEIIVSSSGTFCLGVHSVDGKSVGGRAGETLVKLRKAVLDEAEGYIRLQNQPGFGKAGIPELYAPPLTKKKPRSIRGFCGA